MIEVREIVRGLWESSRGRLAAAVSVGVLAVAIACVGPATCASGSDPTRAEFERKYNAWVNAVRDWASRHVHLSYTPELPEQRRLEDMGGDAVPYLIELFELDMTDHRMVGRQLSLNLILAHRLTLKRFAKECYPPGQYADHHIEKQLLVKWWRQERANTAREFDKLHTQWRRLEKEGKKKEADAALERIRDMGLDALPLVMKKIEAGDKGLVEVADWMMWRRIDKHARTPDEALKLWKANKDKLTLPPTNPSGGKK